MMRSKVPYSSQFDDMSDLMSCLQMAILYLFLSCVNNDKEFIGKLAKIEK